MGPLSSLRKSEFFGNLLAAMFQADGRRDPGRRGEIAMRIVRAFVVGAAYSNFPLGVDRGFKEIGRAHV